MREIVNNLKTSPLKLEMATLKNYKPVEHGLMAAKNFAIAKRYGANYEDIMKFIENGCINNFESDAVQMPLLTVAKRISNPIFVKNIIIQDQISSLKSSNLVGMKVLLSVISKVAYNIQNIEDFIYITDLLQENITKEKALLTQYAQHLEYHKIGQETSQMFHNIPEHDFQKAVTDLILNLQLPVSIDIRVALEPSSLDDVLCNIQGQSCLFDIAERLSNSLYVKQIITTEALKHGELPKLPGFLAVRKVLENTHVQHTQVIAMLSDKPVMLEKLNKYISACQSIASMVKISQESLNITYMSFCKMKGYGSHFLRTDHNITIRKNANPYLIL